jgi:hypothetical protein
MPAGSSPRTCESFEQSNLATPMPATTHRHTSSSGRARSIKGLFAWSHAGFDRVGVG